MRNVQSLEKTYIAGIVKYTCYAFRLPTVFKLLKLLLSLSRQFL
jgi:hypothetical protein